MAVSLVCILAMAHSPTWAVVESQHVDLLTLVVALQDKRRLPDDISPFDHLIMTRKQLYQKYVKNKQK